MKLKDLQIKQHEIKVQNAERKLEAVNGMLEEKDGELYGKV